jgi:hypothetical protein
MRYDYYCLSNIFCIPGGFLIIRASYPLFFLKVLKKRNIISEFGMQCYRKNPQHRTDYKHTSKPRAAKRKAVEKRKKAKKNNGDHVSGESDANESDFIDDDSDLDDQDISSDEEDVDEWKPEDDE